MISLFSHDHNHTSENLKNDLIFKRQDLLKSAKAAKVKLQESTSEYVNDEIFPETLKKSTKKVIKPKRVPVLERPYSIEAGKWKGTQYYECDGHLYTVTRHGSPIYQSKFKKILKIVNFDFCKIVM